MVSIQNSIWFKVKISASVMILPWLYLGLGRADGDRNMVMSRVLLPCLG